MVKEVKLDRSRSKVGQKCLECRRPVGSDCRRGLCRRCYRNPAVAERYEPLPRGPWSLAGYTNWSGYDRVKLIELYESGLSDREIGLRLGRSSGAIAKQRYRMGLMWVYQSRQGIRRIERPRKHW